LYCENCGLQFLPVQSFCTRCGITSTRHWFQLMGLITLVIAAGGNSAVGVLLLPRLLAVHSRRPGFAREIFALRAWMWTDLKIALYGWIPLALGLLAWDYFFRHEPAAVMSEKLKGWLVRGLLILAVATGMAPLVPTWLRPPAAVLVTAAKFPRVPALASVPGLSWLLPWSLVAAAAALLCINAQSRDSLLGHGRVLGVLSLATLSAVLILLLLIFPS
jgi:hypothetical protein